MTVPPFFSLKPNERKALHFSTTFPLIFTILDIRDRAPKIHTVGKVENLREIQSAYSYTNNKHASITENIPRHIVGGITLRMRSFGRWCPYASFGVFGGKEVIGLRESREDLRGAQVFLLLLFFPSFWDSCLFSSLNY